MSGLIVTPQSPGGGGGITPEYAIVKATSSQSLTAGSWTKFTWGTVIVDSNSLTGTSNQFTIQTAGVYTVS